MTTIKIDTAKYSIKKIRMFTNHRGMVGFNLDLYYDGKQIGDVSHDGNSMTYSYFYSDKTFRGAVDDEDLDELINSLLEKAGF